MLNRDVAFLAREPNVNLIQWMETRRKCSPLCFKYDLAFYINTTIAKLLTQSYGNFKGNVTTKLAPDELSAKFTNLLDESFTFIHTSK